MPVPSRRCVACMCPEDVHRHYTRATDTRCGSCGPNMCPRYIDPDWPMPRARMTADQRRTRRLADERQDANTIVLQRYQLDLERSRQRGVIPAQRRPSDEPPKRRRTQSIGGYYREALIGKPRRLR